MSLNIILALSRGARLLVDSLVFRCLLRNSQSLTKFRCFLVNSFGAEPEGGSFISLLKVSLSDFIRVFISSTETAKQYF